MQARGKVLLILMAAAISACRQSEFTPEAYISYVNDKANGYIQSEKVGEYEISAQYRTPGFMAIEDLGTDSLTAENFAKVLKEKEGTHYILFQIAGTNKKSDPLELNIKDKNQYYERLSHMVSGIDKDLYLVAGNDTLPCIMHHFERSYHLTHYHNVLLLFDHKAAEKSGAFTLIYDDQMLDIGKINLVFNKHVSDAPKIIL